MPTPPLPILRTHTTGQFGVRTRLWLVDRHGNRKEEIPIPTPTSGAITANEDTAPDRQLSLELATAGKLQPLRDYVQPELTLVHPDGAVETATQGVYIITGHKRTGRAARISEAVQGHDVTWHLHNTRVGSVSYPPGTDPGPACRALAIQAGWSPALVDIPDTGRTLTAAKNPNPGTSIYAVMVELLNAVDWYAPWHTWDGYLRSRPWRQVSEPADVAFGAGTRRIILNQITEDPDYTRLKNAVTVRRIRQDEPPIWATARIGNPAHPLYYDPNDPNVGWGYEMAADPVDLPDVPDEAAAMAHARSLLADRAAFYQPARVSAIMDLEADMHQIVSLAFKTPSLAEQYAGTWMRRAWTIRLAGITATMDMDVYRSEDIQ